MFKEEVDYRLAKFILVNMCEDNVISDDQMQQAWIAVADYFRAPFLEIDAVGGKIGDGVRVNEK